MTSRPEIPSSTNWTDVKSLANQVNWTTRIKVFTKYHALLKKEFEFHFQLNDAEANNYVSQFMFNDSDGLAKKVQSYLDSSKSTSIRFRWFLVNKARDWLSNEFRRTGSQLERLKEHQAELRSDLVQDDPIGEFDDNEELEFIFLKMYEAIESVRREYTGTKDEWKFWAWEQFTIREVTVTELKNQLPERSRKSIVDAVAEINRNIRQRIEMKEDR